MNHIHIRDDERVLETVLICVHSVFGLISLAVNVLALYKSIFAAAGVLGTYKLILINQAVVNLLLAASVLFLQLRIFITPFGNVFAVLGLASFTNHFIAFLVYTLFSSLFLDYYFLLVIGMLYNCHWIHKCRYGVKTTLAYLSVAALISFVDFVLSGVLFYEDEIQSRAFSRGQKHETILNRHMVFAVRVHEKVLDIVVNYMDAIFMVICIAVLIFLRYRIRVYVRRTEQKLTYIQSELINLIIIQTAIMVLLVIIPSVFYFLLYEYLREVGCDCIISLVMGLACFLLPIFVLRMLRTIRRSHRLRNDDGGSVSMTPSHHENEGPSTSSAH